VSVWLMIGPPAKNLQFDPKQYNIGMRFNEIPTNFFFFFYIFPKPILSNYHCVRICDR
jgi:hypothetical protein